MSLTNYVIKINPQFPRFEVYGAKSVIRNFLNQPLFVSDSFMACEEFIEKAEEAEKK